MRDTVLVRYGVIPEVSRFTIESAAQIERGARVVVRTQRGLELGTVLESLNGRGGGGNADRSTAEAVIAETGVIRPASSQDEAEFAELRIDCEKQYADWCLRIENWELNLELIDLEWTLDRGKLILYVLNERGPDCTKLALQSAAAGLGMIEVQPVDADGLVRVESAQGGCGSGGCGCGT